MPRKHYIHVAKQSLRCCTSIAQTQFAITSLESLCNLGQRHLFSSIYKFALLLSSFLETISGNNYKKMATLEDMKI